MRKKISFSIIYCVLLLLPLGLNQSYIVAQSLPSKTNSSSKKYQAKKKTSTKRKTTPKQQSKTTPKTAEQTQIERLYVDGSTSDKNISFPSEGGTKSLSVSSNVPWELVGALAIKNINVSRSNDRVIIQCVRNTENNDINDFFYIKGKDKRIRIFIKPLSDNRWKAK